jgi:hypothetical protein
VVRNFVFLPIGWALIESAKRYLVPVNKDQSPSAFNCFGINNQGKKLHSEPGPQEPYRDFVIFEEGNYWGRIL